MGEIAEYKKVENLGGGKYWLIKEDCIEKCKVTPSLPNNWTYAIQPPKPPKHSSLITNFTKVLTEEDRTRMISRPVVAANRSASSRDLTNTSSIATTPNTRHVLIAARRTPKSDRIIGKPMMASTHSSTTTPN